MPASTTRRRRRGSCSRGSALNTWAKVAVGAAGRPVTSSHLNLARNGLVAPTVVWGNDGQNSGPGPTSSTDLRQLPQPARQRQLPDPQPDPGARVDERRHVRAGHARRHRHRRRAAARAATRATTPSSRSRAPPATPATFLLNASQVVGAAATRRRPDDYLARRGCRGTAPTGGADAPNGMPSGLTPVQQPRSRPGARPATPATTRTSGGPIDDSGDAIFRYKHQTTGRTTCTTVPRRARLERPDGWPVSPSTSRSPTERRVTYTIGGTTTGDSRLLKVDGRGTCQLCHDPTHTVTPGTYSGPLPAPGTP